MWILNALNGTRTTQVAGRAVETGRETKEQVVAEVGAIDAD